MIQGARLAGAGRIIAVEPIARRREMAGRLGATDLVDPADGDPVEQVRALTGGRGADYVLEAAGMTAAQEQALTTARRAGTIVLTGVERLGATITYPQFELALQGRRVLSCQNGNVRMRRDLPLFVGMLEDGRLDADPIITTRYPLDGINEALAASAEKRDLTGVIVPNGSVLTACTPSRGPQEHAPQRRARARRRRLPGLRRPGARLLSRARRGRAVGRRQVPGVPDLGVARARAAPGIADPAGADDRMIGVDVGGTFTDVVAVRDGRIEVTKVPSDASEPATAVVEGARRLGVQGSAVFNHASTMGLNAVITRRLPKVAFLTTEGFRDILDRGTIRRPLDGQTDPAWRRPFGDAARPLVPRYLRRGVVERMLADGSELRALDADQARRQLAVLRRCEVQGVAICLLNAYVNPAHEEQLRELTREVLGDDVAVSISSETSPLAKEYARASTTVIDVLMKLIFGRYSAQPRRRPARAGLRGRPELRRLRGDAAALARGAAEAVSHRLRRPGRRHHLEHAPRRRAGDRQPPVRRRRRHLDRRLARRRRRAVRQRHLRDRARPGHQRAVDRGVERRRRRRQHRVDLAVGRRPRRARERGLGPRPGVLRARRHARRR